jgi:kynurenine 3-monooxygenase
MMKRPLFDFSQEYIEHGYLELYIPPSEEAMNQMELNYLHIWPRSRYMMIALPNFDKSWTVTLFMPLDVFEQLNCPEKLVEFFSRELP